MAFIAHENYADLFPLTSTNTYAATLPLTNLQDRRLAKVARVTAGSSMTLRVDLGDNSKPVKVLGLLNFNSQVYPFYSAVLAGGTVSWTASDAGFATAPLVSGGTVNLVDRAFDAFPHNMWHVFATPVSARYWQVTFGWAVDAIGVAQAGRFWISDGWVFEDIGSNVGVDRGWSIETVDPSVVRRSRGQQVYADEKLRYRTLNVSVSQLPRQTVFGDNSGSYPNLWRSLQEVLTSAGVSREVVLCHREVLDQPSNNQQFHARAITYGTLVGAPRIEQQDADFYRVNLSIQEAR